MTDSARDRSTSNRPKEVRKVRNAHGTRVARSIVCVRCRASDTVSFAPKDPRSTLCRRCAAQHLGISDREAGILPERDLTCVTCGKVETTTWNGEGDYACRDCHRGIVSKRPERSQNAESVGRVLRVRRKSKDAS